MRVGETFPQIVESRFGFHIVKLLEKDAGGQKTFRILAFRRTYGRPFSTGRISY